MRSENVLSIQGARYVWITIIALFAVGWGQAKALSVETQVLSPVVQANESFGRSNALYGQTMVVGTDNAIAYVYQRNDSGQWIKVASLTPSDGVAAVEFGFRVDISGDTVLVSAYGADSGAGALYVYSKPASGWTDMQETARLTRSGGQETDLLGYQAAIDGDVVVATARDGLDNRVFVYNKPASGWTGMIESAVLTINDVSGDDTGLSVDIQGDVILAGKHTANTTQGAAYVFVKPVGGWASSSTYAAKLTASDAASGDNFGFAVSVDGDTIAVGARYDDLDAQLDAGSAYVFVKPVGGWVSMTETAKLTASDAAQQDVLGWKIDNHADSVVVSAHGDDLGWNDTGSAYVFIKPASGWAGMNETVKLAAATGQTLGEYSRESVSIYGNTVAVGAAKYGIDSNNNAGVMYVYSNSVDLSIVNQDDVDPVDRNSPFTYTLTVTNNHVNNDASQLVVTNTLPAGVSFRSASAGCSHDSSSIGGVVTCSLASLARNGGSAAFEIAVTAGNQPGIVTNMASVASAEIDANSANNSDSETTSIANQEPVAVNDVAEVEVNGIISVYILENDSDADGDELTIVSVTQPAHGQVNLNKNVIKYTPTGNYNGSDSFTYTVSDPYGSLSTATVNVTVKKTPGKSRGGSMNGLYLLLLLSVLGLRGKLSR